MKSRAIPVRALIPAALVVAVGAVAAEQIYVTADERERPASTKNEILPERFLRGYDPITVYFTENVGPGRAPADETRFARLRPAWPGAWTWLDRKTLQFRPAEPWPALQRFSVEAQGAARVLTTMMSAPQAMTPADGTDNLRPFRTLTLTFPQALPLDALKQMLRIEIRDLPGLGDSARVLVERPAIAELPRASHKDPATYAITLEEDVPEGKQLVVSLALALGESPIDGKSLWSGRVSTRTAFQLLEVTCSNDRLSVVGGPRAPRESALDCGTQGELPQLVFSAQPGALTLTAVKRLVRLEPAVADLRASVFGGRVQLQGKLVPDTLYKMKLGAAPVMDAEGRQLQDPGEVELYFYVGWRRPFLRFRDGQAMLEQKGPRMVPLVGYGEPRADVRIHRIDPLHTGLWPFPGTPVVVNEEQAPPFPGEEPATPPLGTWVDGGALAKHLRLLGSPLVSRVFDLPLLDKSGTTTFGLDIGPALDGAVGARRPGTYLVGLRRLHGAPERSWVRVQVTNLTVTTVEERGKAVFFVRTLDGAQPVSGARITIEAENKRDKDGKAGGFDRAVLTTDAQGRAVLDARPRWLNVLRVTVASGEDVVVLDPRDAPPRFFANHWASGSAWLKHVTSEPPAPQNDRALGFLFVERPIYRPGETVFLKGFARDKRAGVLAFPRADPKEKLVLKVAGPGGQEWVLPTKQSVLYGVEALFEEKDPPTGDFTATLFHGSRPLARRTFKIEAYRVPTFEIQLSGPLAARLDGPFKVKAVARYYAGGTVANEKIRWTVTRRPHHHVPKGLDGYLFASSSQFARPEARGKDDRSERSGELDENGADEIEVNPALDLDGSPRVYRFEATVTGADNQEVSAVTEVRALPPFTLGMKLPRYSKSAMVLEPEIVAVGPDGKLAAGQKVQVRLSKRTWHSHLRESQFATGQASYVTEQEDTKLTELEVTTGAGPVKAKLPTAEAGVYVVEIAGRDKLGRLQTLSADLYVGGREPVAWQKGQAGVFELVPDKERYQPGETANVIVKSPFHKARALVIVEEPAGNRYSFLDVEGGQATVTVPVSREHMPNLPLHVVLMRGRLGESPTDDAPYRPQTMAASLDLAVTPSRNLVKLEVKHPESARPGTKIDVQVTLRDDKGAPLGGEVTLWLVDEAVLSLAKEGSLDPLSAFVVQNAHGTSVSDTRNRVVGRLLEEETPGGDGAEDERAESDGPPNRRVRKNFQTVPYYQATLVVPPSGKLVVPVVLSDDLTNFMVRAVAASGAERFGRWESKLKVRLPVLAQPQLPRFARQGDRFEGGAVARLVEGAEGPGYVKLEMSGPVAERKRSKDIALKASKAASVTFPIEIGPAAAVAPLKIKVDVVRRSDGVGDAFEVTIPVLPDRAFESQTLLEHWSPGTKTMAPFPEAPRPGTVRQDVTVTTALGLLEVMAALQYVDEYPHGCLEQKMARLAPQLALAELTGVLGGFEYAPSLKTNVQRLVAEMPAHQADDGLFAYWPGTAGQVQLTADAVGFMGLAERIGVTIDEKAKSRATEALKRALRSDYSGFIPGYRFNEQSSALRALFGSGNFDDHYLVDLFRTRREMDLMSRTELALAMLRRPGVFGQDLKVAKQELWSSAVFQNDRGRRVFVGVSDTRKEWGGPVLGSSTATIANLLEALVELDPKNPDVQLVLEGLLRRASGGRGFGSTYDNRRAVSAIAAWLQKAGAGKQEVTVLLADKKKARLQELKIGDRPKLARTSVVHDEPLVVTATGAAVQARVHRTWLPAVPGDRVRGLKEGFIVQRAMTLIPSDGSAPFRKDDERAAERAMKVGDVVEMHTSVTTHADRYNVALVVPFAAGFEPLNPELSTSSSEAITTEKDSMPPTYAQRLDHEVRYYFSRLPKGTWSFHFRLKATTRGSWVQPPPIAELMYDQSVRGRGDGLRVIVNGAGQGED
jgi:alpha-2-macroglobulin